jgi:3-dehydroquinate synthetase
MNHLLPEILYGEINEYNSVISDILVNNKGFLIADENTINCKDLIISSALSQLPVIILKAGEKFKSLDQVESVWSFLNTQNANRNDIVFFTRWRSNW